MSEGNVELVHRAYAAWNRGDEEWFLNNIGEDFVLRFPPDFLGLDEVYAGVGGWRRFWETWRGAWEVITVRIHRLEDLGGGEVLAIISFEGVGRGSGAPVSGTVAQRFSSKDGRLVALTVGPPGEALEAAGLRE